MPCCVRGNRSNGFTPVSTGLKSGPDQIIAQKSFPQKGFEPTRIDRTRVFEEQLLGLFLREIATGSPCDGSGMMFQSLGPTERRRTIRSRNYAPFPFMRPTSRLPSTERQITTGKLRGEHLNRLVKSAVERAVSSAIFRLTWQCVLPVNPAVHTSFTACRAWSVKSAKARW